MKTEAIRALANPDGLKPKAHYNALLAVYSKEATLRQQYHYNQGYSEQKLESIIYDVKTMYGISAKDIALYKDKEAKQANTPEHGKTQEQSPEGEQRPVNNAEGQIAKVAENLEENPLLKDMPQDAREGLKLREEYPFLNDASVPDEIKILIADKISAYNAYAAKHAEALQAATEGEAADKLYEIAREAIGNYTLNQKIKAELDYYRDSEGKILGKLPQLGNLRIRQEIDEMSEADLLAHRSNAQKSISKYKKAGNQAMIDEWTLRLTESERHLAEKYNRKFK